MAKLHARSLGCGCQEAAENVSNVTVVAHLEPGEAEEDKLQLADVVVDAERQSPLRPQPQVERNVTAHAVEMSITQMRL